MVTTPYSEGSPSARILFIAEAPGKQEMVMGRPLVGPSGEIFNESLLKAGILRSECAIANVVRTQIPDTSAYIQNNGKLTLKGAAAQADLLERIREYKANVIVPLGALALACMRPETLGRIMKWRGSILPSMLGGRKMVATLHPAFCLPGRGPYVARFTIAKDMKRAAEQSLFPEIKIRRRELLTSPSFDTAISFIKECHKHERVASDLETLNKHVSCFSLCYDPSLSISIPLLGRTPGSDYWTEVQEAQIWQAYCNLMQDRKVVKVWHNGCAFDVPFLFMQNHILSLPSDDTMVKHRIVFPDFPAKLEYPTSIFTDQPYYKDDKKMWMTPTKDPDKFWRYNATDASVTMEIDPQLDALIQADEGYRWTYQNTMESLEPCLYAGMRGMRADKAALQELSKRILQESESKQKELNALVGFELSPSSPKQCIQFFYGTKGYVPYIDRKTHKPTCDDNALARIARKYDSKEAKLVQEIRALNKLRSTYLEIKTDDDGRIRYVYDLRGTTTGRYSSKQTPIGTGANSQNLDPRMKDFLTVEEE